MVTGCGDKHVVGELGPPVSARLRIVVGVVEEFVGVVGVVDLRWAIAVAPGETSVAGGGGVVAVGFGSVVTWAREPEGVGIGATTTGPAGTMVYLAAVPRLGAVRPRAAAISCMADDAVVGGGDAFAASEVQRAVGVLKSALSLYL